MALITKLGIHSFKPCFRNFSSTINKNAKNTTPGVTIREKFLGRLSNNLSSGVVGLANVGKSTFFQAITRTELGNPANYPFATIEPEMSQIIVDSPRLDYLHKLYKSSKKIPTLLKIYDIAGLTRNASSGAGLGNKFLSDIRQVDGIFHVVRGFKDDEIIHIEENKVDPVRDLMIVTDELILKDLEFVETGIEKVEKQLKKPHSNRNEILLELNTLEQIQELLYEGRKVSTEVWSDDKQIEIINNYNLLTAKPTVYLLNVNEQDFASQSNEFLEDIKEWIRMNGPQDKLIIFSAEHETKICNEREQGNTISGESAIPMIVDSMREALRLISFYTCGPKEARQWTIRKGSTAPEAAGCIHTDLQKTFISAQVYKYKDLLEEDENVGINESNLKSKGKQTSYGKGYTVEDGDVMIIKSGGGKKR